MKGFVTVNGQRLLYSVGWSGERLQSSRERPLAFDTETTIVDLKTQVPRMVLASVSDGVTNLILREQDVAHFLLAHRDAWIVGQNISFDYWVVSRHLTLERQQEALCVWESFPTTGRLKDTLLLDMLLVLARGEGEAGGLATWLDRRNLKELCEAYGGPPVNKEDPFRMRYGELLLADWQTVDKGFWEYAVLDAIATHAVYVNQAKLAAALMEKHKDNPGIRKDALEKFGYLSEDIQVRAAIAVAQIGRRGIRVDQTKRKGAEEAVREDLQKNLIGLQTQFPDLFRYQKYKHKVKVRHPFKKKMRTVIFDIDTQQPVCVKSSGIPSIGNAKLTSQLEKIAAALVDEEEFILPYSTGKKKGISRSAKQWQPFETLHPFLGCWTKTATLTKLLSFFTTLHDSVVRPQYNPLLRTGRMSCVGVPLQQIPRSSKMRSLFVAPPGYLLMAVDYAAIELRTLAAVCYAILGRSTLGDVIKSGKDPHCHVASYVTGEPYEHIFGQVEIEKKHKKAGDKGPFPYTEIRQKCKAISFGVPGGLGAAKLAAYAKAQYGVNMTEDEAATLRTKLVTEIYPELSPEDGYLRDNTFANLAFQLNVSVDMIWAVLNITGSDRPSWFPRVVLKVASGTPQKFDGTDYNQSFVHRIWEGLLSVCRRSSVVSDEVFEAIEARNGSRWLADELFVAYSPTLTGRLRGKVRYTQEKNNPFQSVASCGMKEAMWQLLTRRFRVVASIHDELLIELKETTAIEDALVVKQIVEQAMFDVLGGSIPIETEYHLGACWSKP